MEDREARGEEGPPARGEADRRVGPQRRLRAARAQLRVAVVTGASSGIGAELVHVLQRRGVVVVGLSRSPSSADEHEPCDVADRSAVEAVAARVLGRHPRIDLLVNNAGVAARGGFLDSGADRIEQVVRVNYLGSVWPTLAFLPGLGDGSHVVNVVSVAGTVAAGPYSASKHAQLAFSRSLGAELAPRGISVHTILPGFVETPGFPQRRRLRGPFYRLVAQPSLVAERIMGAVDGGRAEIFVPRWYRPAAWAQALAPGSIASARARTSRRRLRSR